MSRSQSETPSTANPSRAARVSCVHKPRNRQQPAGTMRSHAGAWEREKRSKPSLMYGPEEKNKDRESYAIQHQHDQTNPPLVHMLPRGKAYPIQ